MKASSRLQQIPPYPFVEWNAICRNVSQQGVDVIRLDVGDPDLPPPEAVLRKLDCSARDPGAHHYSGTRGSSALRGAMAAYYDRRFGVSLDPERQIVPLLGSKEGVMNLSLACLNPGDVSLIPDPGYAPYTRGALLAGATPVFLPLVEECGYFPDFSAIPIEVADKATLLWLNYPNNPTGACASLGQLGEAVAFARRHNILLCHDTPYADLAYEGLAPPSVLQVPGAEEVAIEFNSLSKTFNMAGWRVGMAVGNPEALALLTRLKSNIDSGMFLPIQAAAQRALETSPAWIETRNATYRRRLILLAEALRQAGLQTAVPRATIYLWVTLPVGISSEVAAMKLLRTAGVSAAPGTFFGSRGEGHLRISVTADDERIAAAADRLRGLAPGWLMTGEASRTRS